MCDLFSSVKSALVCATLSEDGSVEMESAIESARLCAGAYSSDGACSGVRARALIVGLVGGLWSDWRPDARTVVRFVRLVYGLASELDDFGNIEFHHDFIKLRLLERKGTCLPVSLTDPHVVDLFQDLCSHHPPFLAARDRFVGSLGSCLAMLSLDTACLLMLANWLPTTITNLNELMLKTCHSKRPLDPTTLSQLVRLSERLSNSGKYDLSTIPDSESSMTNVWHSVLRAVMKLPLAVGKPILCNYMNCKDAYGIDLAGAIERVVYAEACGSLAIPNPCTALELEIAATYFETRAADVDSFQFVRRMFRLSDSTSTARRFLGVLQSISPDLFSARGLMLYSPMMTGPALHTFMWTHPLAATHNADILAQHYRCLYISDYTRNLHTTCKEHAERNLDAVKKLAVIINTLGGNHMRKLWHWSLPKTAINAIVDFTLAMYE